MMLFNKIGDVLRRRCRSLHFSWGLLLLTPWGAQAFVSQHQTDFFPFTVDENRLTGVPDHSFMNRALTPADRIFVHDGHFYAVGEDGLKETADDRRVRFFGANLSFSANFPEEIDVPRMAKRLRKMGFNAVRLHHLDFFPSDDLSDPRGIITTAAYPTLNTAAVRRLRALIVALSEEGIYVNLNLRVGYRFRPEIDGLPGLDGGQDRPASVGTPIHVYYPPLIEKQEQYARQLIAALGLRDNPVLAMVEINNESSLLAAWQGEAWYGDGWTNTIPSAYAGVLQEKWDEWIVRQYGSIEAACQAWGKCDEANPGRLPDASIAGVKAAQPTLTQKLKKKFSGLIGSDGHQDETQARQDPAQVYKYDFLAFLASMDRAYIDHMRDVVHDAAGAKVPVTGTQMNYGGVLNFDSHAGMDYLDDHIYVGHHVYANGNPWLSDDWRVEETTTSGSGMDRLMAEAFRRDSTKPFVISEYNQPFPTPGGAEILPLMATLAALQDWDGLFFFGYDDSQELKKSPWYFSLSGDWGKYALVGQSARIFREGLIEPLPTRTALPLTREERLFIATQGHIRNHTLVQHARKKFGIDTGTVWTTQLSQDILPDTVQTPTAPQPSGMENADIKKTPDGAVRHDLSAGNILLDTNQVWGVFGQLGRDEIAGKFFAVKLAKPGTQHVNVLVTPLDSGELNRASHLLVSLGGDTTGTQPGSRPPRPKSMVPYPGKSGWLTLEPDPLTQGPSGILGTVAPAWVQRSNVVLTVPYQAAQLQVYALDGNGQRKALLPENLFHAVHQGASTDIHLQSDAETASVWYEIIIAPAVCENVLEPSGKES